MYYDSFQCRKYGLEDDTIDFIGHALALHINDSYLDQPAMDFVKRMKVGIFFLTPFFSYSMNCERSLPHSLTTILYVRVRHEDTITHLLPDKIYMQVAKPNVVVCPFSMQYGSHLCLYSCMRLN